MKYIHWSSLIVAVTCLLILLYIGGYLNPFIVEMYNHSGTTIPERIQWVLTFDLKKSVLLWGILTVFVLGKDSMLKNKTIIILLNILMFLFLVFLFFYYHVFVDTIHLSLI